MRRVLSSARPDWPQKVSSVGLTYHTHESPDGPKPYWCESACYEFTLQEIDKLERAIGELHHLLIEVADHVVERGLWDRLAIPPEAVPLIERSWEADDFSLYGRFDLAFRPGEPPKLLEYNADTPTALVEAAVAQWYWLQEVKPGCDQFNSLHERLIAAWKRFGTTSPGISLVDFASVSDNLEDEQTVSYLMDTAMQAGFRTRWTAVNELGYDQEAKVFVCGEGGTAPTNAMVACFKLYPWEWLVREEFGRYLADSPTLWIEPPWKALLSNKAILALAWERFPRHPNLLPCYFEPSPLAGSYVRKPILSREGANIAIVQDGQTIVTTDGDYGEEGYVYQRIADLPVFDGCRPIIGGWVVDHEPAGIGIRETDTWVTDNVSRFLPHYLLG